MPALPDDRFPSRWNFSGRSPIFEKRPLNISSGNIFAGFNMSTLGPIFGGLKPIFKHPMRLNSTEKLEGPTEIKNMMVNPSFAAIKAEASNDTASIQIVEQPFQKPQVMPALIADDKELSDPLPSIPIRKPTDQKSTTPFDYPDIEGNIKLPEGMFVVDDNGNNSTELNDMVMKPAISNMMAPVDNSTSTTPAGKKNGKTKKTKPTRRTTSTTMAKGKGNAKKKAATSTTTTTTTTKKPKRKITTEGIVKQ